MRSLILNMLFIFLWIIPICGGNYQFTETKPTWRKNGTPDITNLTYSATLSCSLNVTWCYSAAYREHDFFSQDEVLHIQEFSCGNESTKNHTAAFQITGGDGLSFQKTYDMEVYMFHNCTKTTKTVKTWRGFPVIHHVQKTGGGTYKIDLTDDGTSLFFLGVGMQRVKKHRHEVYTWLMNQKIGERNENGQKVFYNIAEEERKKKNFAVAMEAAARIAVKTALESGKKADHRAAIQVVAKAAVKAALEAEELLAISKTTGISKIASEASGEQIVEGSGSDCEGSGILLETKAVTTAEEYRKLYGDPPKGMFDTN
ncbi:hypothetical protein L5515_016353 [Caenorhabditis briggsae]|uniref:Uncharacterized protein n=1 Tax=Caenorhabditis briggsae TaxID=6238 RepID=A0AAE9F5N7_CAEBR|nr:hypothetical protein L5515_016353 [Caenorhabditis briggsae]